MDLLSPISAILGALDRAFDPERLLQEALASLIGVIPGARHGIACVTEGVDPEHLRVAELRGFDLQLAAALRGTRLGLGASLRAALRTGTSAHVDAAETGAPVLAGLGGGVSAVRRGLVAMPLVSGNKTLGLLLVGPAEAAGADALDPGLLTLIGHQIGIALDRSRLVHELRASEERYHDLFHHANDAIYVHDLEMRVIDANEAALTLTGFSREELRNRSILDLVVPEQRELVRAATTSRLQGRDVRPYEVEIVHKDGHHAFVEVNARLVSEGGRPVGVHGVARDVTARRSLEAELSRNRDFVDTLVSNSLVAIIAIDRSGDIQIFNRGAEAVTGYSASEVLGKRILDLGLSTTDPTHWTRQLLAKGLLEEQEARVRRKDGAEVPVLAFLSVLRDGAGHVAGAVGVFVDHTEKLRLERELFRAEKLKALGAMAGGVAHDFNNVLSTILGNVQMLMRQDAPPAGLHRLKTIEEAALTAAETVKRILDFAGQRTERTLKPGDPNELVLDAIDLTRHRWSAPDRSRPIRVRTLLGRVPAVLVNPYEIKEVLMNLLFNAVDALPDGGTIEVRTERAAGGMVIVVSDDGAGMSESVRERVFDPFFTTKGEENSGLGLSVSYGIITRHQGGIEVASELGRGTRFTIFLPEHQGVSLGEIPVQASPRPGSARILVIDDEAGIREILSELLAEEGHEVAVAASGSEGVERFAAAPFDVVITDLSMPHMSGLQVAREIRRLDPDAVCILTSGWAEQRTADGLDSSVADIVLPKPFHLEQVLDSVGRAVDLRRGRVARPEVLH